MHSKHIIHPKRIRKPFIDSLQEWVHFLIIPLLYQTNANHSINMIMSLVQDKCLLQKSQRPFIVFFNEVIKSYALQVFKASVDSQCQFESISNCFLLNVYFYHCCFSNGFWFQLASELWNYLFDIFQRFNNGLSIVGSDWFWKLNPMILKLVFMVVGIMFDDIENGIIDTNFLIQNFENFTYL